MKYTVSVNYTPSVIINFFSAIIDDCGFCYKKLSTCSTIFTISGDGRKIRPFLNRLCNGFGNAKFYENHLF